jgi:uncharacterized protein
MPLSFALLIGLLTLSSVASAQTTTAPGEPVVVVTGEGVVKAAPDQAWVTFAVESRSKNPKDAQAQNAKSMTSVQERLVAAGIPKDAIRTLSYDLQLESDWVNGRQVPRGYVARNTIEVRLDDIARVGEAIDVAITNGANSVHGVRFDLKERASLERDALKRATADARARAEAAAADAGAADARDGRAGRARRHHACRRGRDRDPFDRRIDGVAEVAVSDKLRHRYHAATDRYGRHASAIFRIFLRVGLCRSP